MKSIKNLFASSADALHISTHDRHYPLSIWLLVAFMTIFVWNVGQQALMDIARGIDQIEYPYLYEIPAQKEADAYWNEHVQPLEQQLYSADESYEFALDAYNTGLLEDIAGREKDFYGTPNTLQDDITIGAEKRSGLEKELQDAYTQHEMLQEKAHNQYKELQEDWRRQNRWRQAKVFAYEILFWLPFFLISLSWHIRTKRKESKWEIISLSAYIASGLLALQSLCTLLWSWIPHALLDKLWELLRATIFTRIIGYYIFVLIAIACFGWFIIFVHKRMTDPKRGGMRRIRKGGCPYCFYPLSLSDSFCGSCNNSLKQECSSCKNTHYSWETGCTHCGKK